jgi:hypothetical protein
MGGVIAVVETPDGKFEVKHIEAKEPKAPTEWEVRAAAAQGDPLAIKMLADKKADSEKTIVGGDDLGGLSQADVVHYAKMYNQTGQLPSLGMGKSPLRTAILKEAAAQARREGKSPEEVLGDVAKRKSNAEAHKKETRSYAAMESYVINMKAQVKRLNEVLSDIEKTGYRATNVPLRKLIMTLHGDARYSTQAMYLSEISSEIAKLASGASESVSELSMAAQAKWDKIHDPDLPIPEMRKLLNETSHAGDLRLNSKKQVIQRLEKELGVHAAIATADAAGPSRGASRVRRWNPATGRLEDVTQ